MPGKFTVQQTRALVLSLLAATALVTGAAYLRQSQRNVLDQAPPPNRIPPNVTQSAGFSLSKSEQGRTLFTVKALRARELKDSGKSLLEEVEIVTFGSQGNRHDRIFSKLCEYDAKTGRVHSEGEVEIELASLPGELPGPAGAAGSQRRAAVPVTAGAETGAIFVKTSGLTFEEKTGVASTDRAVEFRFSRGAGRAVGAVYDSHQRTLHLQSDVTIRAEPGPESGQRAAPSGHTGAPVPTSAESSPIEIKAAELHYLQRERLIQLQRPEMRRTLPTGGSREGQGEHAVLTLDAQNHVRTAEFSGNVRLREVTPGAQQDGRDTRLIADRLELVFDEQQSVDQAYATGAVRVDAVTPRSRAEAQATRLELFFGGAEKSLSQVEWKGGVRIVFTPRADGAPVRVLTSEAVQMFLKPGGRELDAARTLAPGRLELLPPPPPAGAGRRSGRRVLTAERFWMQFAEQSELRILRAEKNVRLESEAPPPTSTRSGPTPASTNLAAPGGTSQPGSPAPVRVPISPGRVTTSDLLTAHFSPASQELETLEQTGNFRYMEGEQQASAERAFYSAAEETVTLTGLAGRNPEVWDAHARTSARQITLDQKTDTGTAEHEVRSTHVPEEKPGQAGPGLLSGKDPVHVIAERMVSNTKTGVTRYEAGSGGKRVRLWQKEDVIEARTILLERKERRLTAEGDVATVLVEAVSDSPLPNSGPAPGAARRPIFIRAEHLVYTDHDRRAHYERGVVMRRPASTLKAAALDAYLFPAEEVKPGQSRLERAVARGSVEIVESSPDGMRRAGAELAEYLSAEEKMVLSGGDPYVYDEQRGYTRGRQLTYYVRDDRIFVHGEQGSRTVTEHSVTRRP